MKNAEHKLDKHISYTLGGNKRKGENIKFQPYLCWNGDFYPISVFLNGNVIVIFSLVTGKIDLK